ncbi:MAG: hypothetical protein IKD50_13400, partial [Clostridia bacterium]|nr:hypothetical protein [Clostridia bacterium]
KLNYWEKQDAYYDQWDRDFQEAVVPGYLEEKKERIQEMAGDIMAVTLPPSLSSTSRVYSSGIAHLSSNAPFTPRIPMVTFSEPMDSAVAAQENSIFRAEANSLFMSVIAPAASAAVPDTAGAAAFGCLP